MPDSLDYKAFLSGLSTAQFLEFRSAFGGEDKEPEAIAAWVNSPKREKIVCEKIRQVFNIEILTAAERQEEIAKIAANATQRQADAAEKANSTAEKALRVAKVLGIVAVLAFIGSVIALIK